MEVEHQTAIGDREARHVVAAAADGHQKLIVAGEVHRGNHVLGACYAGDQSRSPIDLAIPDFAELVVPLLARQDNRTSQVLPQSVDRGHGESLGGSIGADDAQFSYGAHDDLSYANLASHQRSGVDPDGLIAHES